MLDHEGIYRVLLIIVVIQIYVQKNGILVVIYGWVYLLHEPLKQVEIIEWINLINELHFYFPLGEELTFEYGVESEFRGDTIFHCLCGAETCTGFMGRSKKLGGVIFFFTNSIFQKIHCLSGSIIKRFNSLSNISFQWRFQWSS
jgi:hypothetical protein